MKARYLALTWGLLAASAQAAEHAGVLDWSGRVSLAMTVSGVVETVMVQPGQNVKKGDLLAALNPALFKAGVAEARADMDRLTEEEAEAGRDLARVKELYNRTVAPTTELDAAKLRHARAVSGLAAAQARLEKARRLLAESELRAPFDAVVLQRMAEPGLVAAAPCQPNPLFTLAHADEILARANLEPAQAARVRPGAAAEVQAGGRSHKGVVRAVSIQGEMRYGIEVALPREAGLMPGLAAVIHLP
ncbi:MAG: efflux RND transporter periplasmic adaptor subunit [Betaproteobacteria bacterium]|nr:efflux RND transporter periplasmic adaptor subunit [Betaproteobacteria bacterium]